MEREQSKYNKNRLFALGVLLLLVILLIFMLWWWFGRSQTPATVVNNPPSIEAKVILPPTRQQITSPNQEVKPSPFTSGELIVMNLARNFTERYGSWSTDTDYQNLDDLESYITARLKNEFSDSIDSASPFTQYKGMDSKALQIDIESMTNQFAQVVVNTQRVETDSNLNTNVTYQKIDLTMRKIGEFWYVDTAEWQ